MLVWIVLIDPWAVAKDNGDGTFTNPVLYADYPDPDIIRVGSDFYLVSSTFTDSPGLALLRSKDLVNWTIVSRIASTLDGGDAFDMIGGTAYEGGFWAPSLRYHNGMFYVAVQPTFANGRICHASDPAGPWSFHQLDRPIYDPGLFIDDDGTGYIVSGHSPQSLIRLSPTFDAVVSQTPNYLDSGGEGSHVIKRGGYYYVFNAVPSVWPFELRCSRTPDLVHPTWETRVVLTAVTGGHQGAIVDIDDGDHWYGFVHQDHGAVGRVLRIGPVFWEDGWPVFGTPAARNVMADTYPKPVSGFPIVQLATSDDFTTVSLGLQWAWNHNPDPTRWSLTERPGWLRLRPTRASGFWTARNTLTQKGQGPQSHGIVKLDVGHLQPGDVAGFGTYGRINGHITVSVDAQGSKTLGMRVIKDKIGEYTAATGIPLTSDTLYLRTDLDFERELAVCSYSYDGASWTTLGGTFPLMFGYGTNWMGEKFALFCYNPDTAASPGYLDVDEFTLGEAAPLVKTQRGRPTLDATRSTFVGDNGQLLRGPYTSTEWTPAPGWGEMAAIRNLGFNAVHLYAEVFDPTYPAPGSVAPGYAVTEVDKVVQMTRDLGLYLIITIGNGAHNGSYNAAWVHDFWSFYAPRYADETHVLFEIQNEPVAWGPPYLTATTPPGALAMEVDAYNTIRAAAPDTPVLLFTYAVFVNAADALIDIAAFQTAVGGDPAALWTNAAIAVHGYGGFENTTRAIEDLIAAGYPCVMTEFGDIQWGVGGGFGVEQTAELERLGVSWTTFQFIPPFGVSEDVTKPGNYFERVERGGLAWTPDFGTWPVARRPYANGGLPRATTRTFIGDMLTGTLRIEAEDFDEGREGIAYHDNDRANWGGAYRPETGVNLTTNTTDAGGGYIVGWTGAGEWLEYTVFVAEPGFYDFRLRYATPATDGRVRVSFGGRDKTGEWTLPTTGSFATWATATRPIFLEFGRQKLRVEILDGGLDLNWFELTPQSSGPVPDGTYKIVNRRSGLAMTNDASSHTVVQQAYAGSPFQHWTLHHVGAGEYRVTSAVDDWNWHVFYGLPNERLELVFWWGTEKNQRFVVRPAGDGYYRIAPVQNGFDLEIANASPTSGTLVQQNPFAAKPHQQWAILPLNAPLIPSGLEAERVSAHRVDLTWRPTADATTYRVKRATTRGGPYTTIATDVASTSYSDLDVADGVPYFYVVSAVNAQGESLDSAEASATLYHAYLKFDDGAGTVAADASGNGWTGSLVNGPAWAAGRVGYAVDLDGVDDYIELPAGIVEELDAVTIAAWVKLDAASTWSRIFDFGTGTAVNMFLTPRCDPSHVVRFAITVTGAGGEQRIDGHAPLPVGVWTHVAVTLDGSSGVLYVDGIEVGRNPAMTLTPRDLGQTHRNFIGKSQYADPYLDGRVDEFRIYARALGPAEVQQLMSSSRSAVEEWTHYDP